MKMKLLALGILLTLITHQQLIAQNYKLVWEDQFNGTTLDSSKWNIEDREGIWNTGANKEFQHYKTENVSVGDDGEGNNCLIITAKQESYNGYDYTSGRVNTKGKFAFRRGKIEALIKIPDLANGLWPAFWTLGYTPTGWPDCGEIDIMEMGHAAGISQNKQNSYMGAHLFWGPYPSDYGENYVATEDLSTGYFKQTAVWTEDKIAVYFNDSPSPYFSMGIDGGNTEEFRNFQDYILFNMAVGGSVPGIYNKNEITANFPAKMYVDWVKVYQEEDAIDFDTSDLALFGNFGVFEENLSTDMKMQLGYDVFEITTGVESKTDETPYSGSEVLSYNTTATSAFNIKLRAGSSRNMENYSAGSIQFYIKTNLETELHLGVSDTLENEGSLVISTNGEQIKADNEWHKVYVPLSELSDKVDLKALKEMLTLSGESSTDGYLSIDEITYTENSPIAVETFGIYTDNPSISDKFILDDINGHLYNWSNTVSFNSSLSAYEGEEVLSFRSSGAANWWGFGFFSDAPMNFEPYANGTLHLALRTESTENFTIGMQGANDTSGEIQFSDGNDPYDFVRDGHWHTLIIPMSDLVSQGLDLSECGNIFTMSGGSTGDVAIDDIYLSENEFSVENSAVCYPASLELLPKNSSTKTGRRKHFRVNIEDQFGNDTDASVHYSSDGGTIDEEGIFTSQEAGTFKVWATAGNLVDSTTITVEQSTTGIDQLDDEVELYYFPSSKELQIHGTTILNEISIYNLAGAKVYSIKTHDAKLTIDLSRLTRSSYLLLIDSRNGIIRKRINNW